MSSAHPTGFRQLITAIASGPSPLRVQHWLNTAARGSYTHAMAIDVENQAGPLLTAGKLDCLSWELAACASAPCDIACDCGRVTGGAAGQLLRHSLYFASCCSSPVQMHSQAADQGHRQVASLQSSVPRRGCICIRRPALLSSNCKATLRCRAALERTKLTPPVPEGLLRPRCQAGPHRHTEFGVARQRFCSASGQVRA